MFNPKVILYGDESRVVNEISQMVNSFYEFVEISYEQELFLPKTEINSTIVIILQSFTGEHGLHKLKEIRSAYPDLPIILLLVKPKQSEIINVFRFGASDVLMMPMTPKELVNRLHKHTQQLKLKKKQEKLLPSWLFKMINFIAKFRRKMAEVHLPVENRYAKPYYDISTVIPVAILPANESEVIADIKANFLGPFSILVKGKQLHQGSLGKKATALFLYLLYYRKRFIHREKLMDMFWPDSNPASARNCLNVAICCIRKALQEIVPNEEFIVFQNESYGMNPNLNIELDAEEFSRYWQRGQNIEQTQGLVESCIENYHNAIAIYKGDFLQDIIFEEWVELIRENLKETYLAILGRLSSYICDQKQYAQTTTLCKKMLQKDNCLEEAHRRLMYSYYKLGMRDKAIRQFKKCKKILKEELNVLPSRSTMDLYQQIIL